MKQSVSFLLTFAIAASGAWAQNVPAPAEFASVRDEIAKQIENGAAPSVAVAVVREDKVIWAEGFGYANVEKKTPATADSIYLLASVSKPITATGLMLLKDQGLIDLDKPANDYLPSEKIRAYIGNANDITIRRLANHTGGLPTHYSFFYDNIAPPSMDETIRRWAFAATRPGSEYNYSNLAFGILNYITEVVSETPWSEFMVKDVYDSIGMTRTADFVRPEQAAEATVQYTRDPAGRFVPVAPYEFDHPGASAIWSSANDLARFLRMHLNDGEVDGVRLLSESAAREMRAIGGEGAVSRMGVAWGVSEIYGKTSFAHTGGMPGVGTIVRGFPEDRAAYVVLVNADPSPLTNNIATLITKALYPDAEPSAPSERNNAPEETVDFAGKWAGRIAHYAGDIPIEIVIENEKDAKIRFGSGPGQRRSLESVQVRGDRFSGAITAFIPTQESFHGVPRLAFNLRRDGDRLTGTVFATAPNYFGLSFWTELDLVSDSD